MSEVVAIRNAIKVMERKLREEGMDPDRYFYSVLIPCVFNGRRKWGDYQYMIELYPNALFVYCGNAEEDSGSSVLGRGSPGGGSASVRGKRNALGVATGKNGRGFPHLTREVKELIDKGFCNIQSAIETYGYDIVFFPADPVTGFLGSGIFQVGEEVKDYIYAKLLRVTGLIMEKPRP